MAVVLMPKKAKEMRAAERQVRPMMLSCSLYVLANLEAKTSGIV